jgi:hypothetical protein
MVNWDAIYKVMQAAHLRPVKRGWKFRPDGPVEIYTDIADKAAVAAVLSGFCEIDICQTGTRVSVFRHYDVPEIL